MTSFQETVDGNQILRCPACKGPLNSGPSVHACATCATSYPEYEGILSFSRTSTMLGEFSHDQMRHLVRQAQAEGWKKVLATRIQSDNQSVVDLIANPRRSSFLDLLPMRQGDVAIDIGCGYGGISLQLAEKYRAVFALDSGLERLQFLNVIRKQENLGGLHPIHHHDVTSLPFASDSADLIIMVGVFEYLPLAFPGQSIAEVQNRVLRELYRVLKRGGHLYIGTKNRFGWPYWRGVADHNMLRFGPILPRMVAESITRLLYRKPYRIAVDSLPAYRRMLETAGFRSPRFYWPLPGYQVPERFIPLVGLPAGSPGSSYPEEGWKRSLFTVLGNAGLLKYLVPHFSIVAAKS